MQNLQNTFVKYKTSIQGNFKSRALLLVYTAVRENTCHIFRIEFHFCRCKSSRSNQKFVKILPEYQFFKAKSVHSNIGDILIYQCIYIKIRTAERKTRVISAARIKIHYFCR